MGRILVRDLCKRYRDVIALDCITFEVEGGEVFGLLGPNGAGKTTMVEVVAGLRRPTSGEARIDNHQTSDLPPRVRARIGLQLQYPYFEPKIRVGELLDVHTAYYDPGPPREQIERVLETTGLSPKTLVERLSTGQRQRLALALALATDAEILILDEPTLGLDPQGRRRIWEVIRSHRRDGRVVLLTTNYMEEAQALCDRIAIIHRGRLLALGSPSEIISQAKGASKDHATLEEAFLEITRRSSP